MFSFVVFCCLLTVAVVILAYLILQLTSVRQYLLKFYGQEVQFVVETTASGGGKLVLFIGGIKMIRPEEYLNNLMIFTTRVPYSRRLSFLVFEDGVLRDNGFLNTQEPLVYLVRKNNTVK